MISNIPKLHGYWRSSCTSRVRILLNLKGIEFKFVPVNLLEDKQKSPEFKALNPACLVPALEINGHILTESMPICEYLEEMYPEKKLYPEDLMQRFEVRRLCEVINSGTQPVQNRGVLKRIKTLDGDTDEWAAFTIRKGL